MSAVPVDPARYSLLTSAVAGRKLAIVSEDIERPYTDGEMIFARSFDDPDLMRAGLVVQAGLLAAESLDGKTVTRLTGRRQMRLRYLTLEAIRAMSVLDTTVPRPIAERVLAIYDGKVSESKAESLERVVKGREKIPEAPEWLGTIKPSKVLRNQALDNASAPSEKQLQMAAKGEQEDMFDEFDDEEESERSKIMELFSAPAMRNPLAEYVQKLLGMGRSPSSDGGGGDEMPVGGSRVGKVGKNAREAGEAPEGIIFDLGGPPLGRWYPEWDWQKKRYKPDHCAVAEWDPRQGEDDDKPDPGYEPKLARELAKIGLAQERHRRQQQGDALDLTAVIEYVIDKKGGGSPDTRVYEEKRKTAHDLGVVVLLDATGSTGESDQGERVFDEQRQLAARLTNALDELGNRVACFGFQSWGRESVRFLRVKTFDDRYDHGAQRRLAALQPSGFTRLGAAIRHATWMLSEQAGTDNMLLILVGDGLPYDDGYEHRYAQEDSRRSLQEAVAEGIACACVSVRTSTEEDIMERVWGAVPYRRLEHPNELAREVGPLFRVALKEAGATRRRLE